VDKGYVDPKNLQFVPERFVQIRTVTPGRVRELDALEREHAELFREHPVLAARDEVLSLQRSSNPAFAPPWAPIFSRPLSLEERPAGARSAYDPVKVVDGNVMVLVPC
jgi:hypothetical protein